ncbi:MAG: hypothetical protein ACRD50_12440 [Candidatus Acidiferrales bacterium]
MLVTVPTEEFPPATPFTLHVTLKFGLPALVTLAENVWAAPVGTLAEVGAIFTVTSLEMATLAEPLADGAAWLVAVTVTVAGFGSTAGAVYIPLADIVPMVEFPPATPFTLQETFVLLVPVTAAENDCETPNSTEVEVGLTCTITFGGGGGGDEPVLPHAASEEREARANPPRSILRFIRRKMARCCVNPEWPRMITASVALLSISYLPSLGDRVEATLMPSEKGMRAVHGVIKAR